jgi:hypothetical protein
MSNKGLPQSRRQVSPDIRRDGTYTSKGFIPHLRHQGIVCPVKLATVRTARGWMLVMKWDHLPQPVRRGNCYVYALPGGYTVEGPIR